MKLLRKIGTARLFAITLVLALLFFAPLHSEGSLWKLLTARWGPNAGETDQVRIDGATNTLQAIELEHAKIHSGDNYEYVEVVDLSQNNVRDIQMVTANTTEWAHVTFSFETESETDWYLYENVLISTPGVMTSPFNSHRNNSSKATPTALTLRYIDNTSVANANADTVVTSATQLMYGISGSKKETGILEHSHEIVLKQNEDYTLRFIASTAGYVSYHITWYEHTNLH